MLNDFESSTAKKGERPSAPRQLPQDEIEEKKSPFIDVAPETAAFADEDATTRLVNYDDTGVDQVGILGDKLNLEEVRPDEAGDHRGYHDLEKQIRPWTPSEIDTIKESITEEKILGVLPDFPGSPDQQ